jgi:polyisoprenoid-binding protein YceI
MREAELTSDFEPMFRPAALATGLCAIDSEGSWAVLGVDDWAFGQVEAILGPVSGAVVVPWRFDGEPFSAHLSIGLATLTTGHRRLDRRLRSAELSNVERMQRLHVRAADPRQGDGGHWRLTGMITLGSVTDAVQISGHLSALAVDSAVATVRATLDRRHFGLTRYWYWIGPQLRLHVSAQLTHAGL